MSNNEDTSFDEEFLKTLVDFAKSTGLEEVLWEKDGRKVSFRRNANGTSSAPVPSAPKEKNGSAPAPSAESSTVRRIPSPMVGTFWRAEARGRQPLVAEGATVKEGQRIAVVEAMKIPKDVVTKVSGKISKILVENGKSVEYGQDLFEIEI
ncbi:MAG TPA: acetyl-CoA carboxylase biotin carboxyl carrier protein subunit [Elusimicrobiota bacterium]|nr:acetyl-CoA carboxylase biotin carboxyl carrier protein subunit [Elusimicrobiota bacterium]